MRSGVDRFSFIYLKQSEVCIAERPTVVSTVLGSCISVTMFHPQMRVGGICHALLPRCPERKDCGRKCSEVFRYVDCSIERMLATFSARHACGSDLEVKLFGGSNMIQISQGFGHDGVGNLNIRAAEKIFESRGVKPVAVDVGGSTGRKIIFYTHTGDVYVKRLSGRLFSRIASRR